MPRAGSLARWIAVSCLALTTAAIGAALGYGQNARQNQSQSANQQRTDDPMLTRPCEAAAKKPAPCLYHWTLTSRLGHILETYEKILGPRDPAYRLLGLEFTTVDRPRIWYPNFGNGMNSVIVQLSSKARQDRGLALFQLGHEAFHLIEPVPPGQPSSYFEEGLASYYAVRYLTTAGITDGARFVTGKHYRAAYAGVAQLARQHPDFDQRIRRFRQDHGGFSGLTATALRTAFPATPAALPATLARPFPNALALQR